ARRRAARGAAPAQRGAVARTRVDADGIGNVRRSLLLDRNGARRRSRRGVPPARRGLLGDRRGAHRSRDSRYPVVSFDVTWYLKFGGSSGSFRPSAVSPCGYMKNASGTPVEPGSFTSCAWL